ncbi:hypothetical protein NEOLEDRAFT_1147438 [Neolentinus lepideus HHB14362 ss-1]|uniref:Uncharacterized protein n=1 Tax=Neolentinus lepideus HHB14362 ss-1 TaxID=1314782 RepID=A0A165T1K2_9AGAM|nr:hypothetical protein NEOLEDRAFT_1147438 [Neolentinus lepideus HHB14362 ss-1]
MRMGASDVRQKAAYGDINTRIIYAGVKSTSMRAQILPPLAARAVLPAVFFAGVFGYSGGVFTLRASLPPHPSASGVPSIAQRCPDNGVRGYKHENDMRRQQQGTVTQKNDSGSFQDPVKYYSGIPGYVALHRST